MKTAYLFPGQGSQKVGMGRDYYTSNELFARHVNEANEILGFDLKKIMFEGPEGTLKQTEYTQPAIFLHSVALFSAMGGTPDMVAGHSLGEFSALVACKAAPFEEVLKVVHKRGELMQMAGKKNPGTMAALIGMDNENVEQVCKQATEETGKEVVAANFNCPGQLVISGDVQAVEKAVELARQEGCRLAKVLPVSGAFHSSLMEPAFNGLKNSLEELELRQPVCPIYSNYTAKPTEEVSEIKENLLRQLLNPVRWTQTLQNMHKDGATKFVEIGPGTVLQGLVKRTLDDVEIEGKQ